MQNFKFKAWYRDKFAFKIGLTAFFKIVDMLQLLYEAYEVGLDFVFPL